MTQIEVNDDVVFSFVRPTVLEVYTEADTELNSPEHEVFDEDEQIEVTILNVDDNKYDVQFGDGSIAFLRKNDVKIFSIN